MWKIQLTLAINFISLKDNDEERVIHSKSDNIEIMINDKADEVIEELFQSLLSKHQVGLETSMRGSDFIFDCVHLLYYGYHQINFKRFGSYVATTKQQKSKNKKALINPNKKYHKCFQYVVTIKKLRRNHEEIMKKLKNTCKE